ncbi:MAG: hypothetical protein AAGF12_02115 [Myxococcota bacterium]
MRYLLMIALVLGGCSETDDDPIRGRADATPELVVSMGCERW